MNKKGGGSGNRFLKDLNLGKDKILVRNWRNDYGVGGFMCTE
jgi:hypothetical protein